MDAPQGLELPAARELTIAVAALTDAVGAGGDDARGEQVLSHLAAACRELSAVADQGAPQATLQALASALQAVAGAVAAVGQQLTAMGSGVWADDFLPMLDICFFSEG
jgi:hypothetical protein